MFFWQKVKLTKINTYSHGQSSLIPRRVVKLKNYLCFIVIKDSIYMFQYGNMFINLKLHLEGYLISKRDCGTFSPFFYQLLTLVTLCLKNFEATQITMTDIYGSLPDPSKEQHHPLTAPPAPRTDRKKQNKKESKATASSKRSIWTPI